jgi:hypothetical protein
MSIVREGLEAIQEFGKAQGRVKAIADIREYLKNGIFVAEDNSGSLESFYRSKGIQIALSEIHAILDRVEKGEGK